MKKQSKIKKMKNTKKLKKNGLRTWQYVQVPPIALKEGTMNSNNLKTQSK